MPPYLNDTVIKICIWKNFAGGSAPPSKSSLACHCNVFVLCCDLLCFACCQFYANFDIVIWSSKAVDIKTILKQNKAQVYVHVLWDILYIYESHLSPVHVWVILHNLLTEMLRCFESLATWLAVQQFVKVTTKKTPFLLALLCGKPPVKNK